MAGFTPTWKVLPSRLRLARRVSMREASCSLNCWMPGSPAAKRAPKLRDRARVVKKGDFFNSNSVEGWPGGTGFLARTGGVDGHAEAAAPDGVAWRGTGPGGGGCGCSRWIRRARAVERPAEGLCLQAVGVRSEPTSHNRIGPGECMRKTYKGLRDPGHDVETCSHWARPPWTRLKNCHFRSAGSALPVPIGQ